MGTETALALAGTFSGAVVAAMATDAWQETRTRIVSAWRRFQPDVAERLHQELEAERAALIAQSDDSRRVAESELVNRLRIQLLALIQADTAAITALADALYGQQQNGGVNVHQVANARGNGRVFMAGRDQKFTGHE